MRGQFTFAAIAVALVLAADSGSGSGEASSGSEYSSGSGAVESGGSGVIEASSGVLESASGSTIGSGVIEPSSGSVEPPSPPASPVPPTPPPTPPNPPPPPTDTAIAIEAAQLAPPAFTLKAAPLGGSTLLVDGASPLAALRLPIMIRIAVGRPQQEDLVVKRAVPLHPDRHNKSSYALETSTDGRFTLHLGSPLRYNHVPGEALRHVERQRSLGTQFIIHRGGGDDADSHLFDARILGPDAPHLHADGGVDTRGNTLELQYDNITANGYIMLHDGIRSRALSTALSAAIRGWAAFSFEPHMFAAPAVAIRMYAAPKAQHPGGLKLSRGGSSAQDDIPQVGQAGASVTPPPLRALVGVLDPSNGYGYWTNVSEDGSGWVAKLRLSEFPKRRDDLSHGGMPYSYNDDAAATQPTAHRAYWDGGEKLTASERLAFGLGEVGELYGSPLYARYTRTSELGLSPETMRRVKVRASAEALAEEALGGEKAEAEGVAGWPRWPSLPDEEEGGDEAEEGEIFVYIDYDLYSEVWHEPTGDWKPFPAGYR